MDASTADVVVLLRAIKQRPGKSLADLFYEAATEIENLRSERDTLDVMAEVGFDGTMKKGATVERMTAALKGIELALARDNDIDGAMILVLAALKN